MKTYYDTLEVSKNASGEVIKRAHNVLIKKYHPDLASGNEKKEAEKKTAEINEAYEILKDPLKREKYDEFLKKAEILNENKKEEENQKYNKDSVEKMEIELANKKLNDEINSRVNKAQEDIDKEQVRIQKKMQEDYNNYLRQMGIPVKEKGTNVVKKKIKKILIQIVIFLIIFGILSIIYKTNINYKLLEFESENEVLKILGTILRTIVNLVWKIFGL